MYEKPSDRISQMEQMNLNSPFNFLDFHLEGWLSKHRLQVITGRSFSWFATKGATPLRPHFPGLTSAAVYSTWKMAVVSGTGSEVVQLLNDFRHCWPVVRKLVGAHQCDFC